MNRNEEYNALLTELNAAATPPPALTTTVTRAGERAKRSRRVRNFLVVPVTAMAVLFAAFVTTINVSADFAEFCERIPTLNKLAAALEMKPSLKIAIENDYGQTPDGLEQTVNGITMKIEHVIVDEKQLHIFYSLRSDIHAELSFSLDAQFHRERDKEFGYSGPSSSSPIPMDGVIRRTEINILDGDMPPGMEFIARVSDPKRSPHLHPLVTFRFTLPLDPANIRQAETVAVDQDVIIDGQRLTIASVKFLPTHTRVIIIEDENNTAQLSGLAFHAINERGERFDQPQRGTRSTGMAYHLESSFFTPSRRFTLYITETTWQAKGVPRVTVDLLNGTAENLPPDVRLEKVWLKQYKGKDGGKAWSSWCMMFQADQNEANSNDQLFSAWYDENGKKRHGSSAWSWPGDYGFDETTRTYKKPPPGTFLLIFSVETLEFSSEFKTIHLDPIRTRIVTLDEPVEIKVK